MGIDNRIGQQLVLEDTETQGCILTAVTHAGRMITVVIVAGGMSRNENNALHPFYSDTAVSWAALLD